jgi:exonuclease VII small subunit
MASVAEVKAAIDTAVRHVEEGQQAVRAAGEKLSDAQQSLAAAVDGSGHDAVGAAHAALQQASTELDDCLTATLHAVEQVQSYAAAL